VTSLLEGRSGIGVHQRRKFFEMRNQYELSDESGHRIGAVEQVGQSPFAFAARLVSDLDAALPVTLQVSDDAGKPVLTVHKPWFRYRVTVNDAEGRPLGFVAKRIRLGKAAFDLLDANGQPLGQMLAENWRARDFRIEGPSSIEVARVTKKWRGLATEMFTDADSYALTFESTTGEPMRSLALAAALSVDLTMKQKDY
jgi:uncharacterized protein YxjI